MTENRFEERLLTELRAHVAHHTPNPAPVPPRGRAGRYRLAPVVAAGGVLAAAAVAVVLATGGDGADPAYAVTPQTDGSVSVTVTSLNDVDGLQQALEAAGVKSVVRRLPPGKVCQPLSPAGSPNSVIDSLSLTQDTGVQSFTVSASRIRDGDTLLVTASADGTIAPASIAFAMVEGDDTRCRVIDAPPVPEAPAGAPDAGGSATELEHPTTVSGPTTHTGP